MRLGLFVLDNEKAISIRNEIVKKGLSLGYEFCDTNPDVVISIGGDGTFLRSVHKYMYILNNVDFICVNAGTLGFYSNLEENEIDLLFSSIANKDNLIESHRLLKADLFCDSNKETIYAINEVRIENPFKTLVSHVDINSNRLESYRGNGLVVSSEIGTTAYNKSLGGAIVGNDLDVMELTEIAPIQNSLFRCLSSSLVVSGNSNITFSGSFNNIIIGYDHLTLQKNELTSICITKSDKFLKIIQPKKDCFINSLRRSFIL